MLGFGRNKEIIKLKSSIVKQQVELITKIISKLNLEKLTLVFHSLSTVFFAFYFKKKIKNKISNIILIEGDVDRDQVIWAKKISEMKKKI